MYVETNSFQLLEITRDWNNIEKNPEHTFVHIGEWKACAKLQQKIFNSMVVGARQGFQIFRQIT